MVASKYVEAVAMNRGYAPIMLRLSIPVCGELPDGEKTPARIPGLISAKLARELYQDGVFGGPYQASEEIMSEIFSAALQDILQHLRFE
jgi:hypothetical protein